MSEPGASVGMRSAWLTQCAALPGEHPRGCDSSSERAVAWDLEEPSGGCLVVRKSVAWANRMAMRRFLQLHPGGFGADL